ncbi:MAG: hypothetical protein WCT37_05100 [Patescibacteria group bacterium]
MNGSKFVMAGNITVQGDRKGRPYRSLVLFSSFLIKKSLASRREI